MADNINMEKEHYVADDSFAQNQLSGRAQLVYASSNKAKRISYSTSHGETLAAINGLENATLLSARFSEITTGGNKPSIHDLLAVQEHGARHFPVDAATDCRDVFELTTGHRSLPQDKSQRLYILAHREARAAGRLRWFVLLPTECMTADSLTKVMQCPNMMELLTTGRVKFFNTGHSIEMKRLPPQTSVSEEDLLEGDNAIIRNTEKAIKELYAHFGWVCAATAFGFNNKKPLARAVFFASMLTQTAAHKTEDTEDWIMGYFMILATMGVIAITLMLEWMQHTVKTNVTMIEEYVIEKAEARRRRGGERRFVFPYDLGKQNAAAVLGKGYLSWLMPGGPTPGDPVWPELRPGSTHFDISTEQIAQKTEKLQRSVVMPVEHPFSGEGRCCFTYWCWVGCSFGCCAVCDCEACGEHRLSVAVGEAVLVSKSEGSWVHGRAQRYQLDTQPTARAHRARSADECERRQDAKDVSGIGRQAIAPSRKGTELRG
ncbi:unnamed protein product [Effrenium voratum]|nr:unnamed protein product [Effrenium voratum]